MPVVTRSIMGHRRAGCPPPPPASPLHARPGHRRRYDRGHRAGRRRGRRRRSPAATRSSRSTSRSRAGSSTSRRRSGRRPSPPAARRWPAPTASPTAVGITNQRETAVLWDRETLRAPRAARSSGRTGARPTSATRLRDAGARGRGSRELTGLRLDPYFTGTKLTWLAENDPHAWAGVSGRRGRRRHRRLLPGRPADRRRRARHRRVATPRRTLLFDLPAGAWSDELCDAVRRAARGAAGGRPVATATFGAHRPGRVPRARPADRRASPATSRRRCSGRPASTPAQQVHLRHRLVRAGEHRHRRRSAPTPGC